MKQNRKVLKEELVKTSCTHFQEAIYPSQCGGSLRENPLQEMQETTVKIRYLQGLYRVCVILVNIDPKGLAGQSLEMWDSEKAYLSCTEQINFIWRHKLMRVVSYLRYK